MNNTTLKVAVLQIHELIMDIGNDGKTDGKCSLKGMFGEIFNVLLGKIIQDGYRCVAQGFDQFGRFNETSGRYDGAIGALQKGEIGAVAMPAYFPLKDPGNNFIYSPILYEDTMTIASAYSIETQFHYGDLLTMFSQVPYGLWIGYFTSFIIFLLISVLGARILNQNFSSFWMTTCAFLDQDNYPTNSKFLSTLSLVVMVGIFFMMAYASNSMSADLITIDKPIAVTTYDDILNRRIKAAFTTVLPEWEKFRDAPVGSKEKRLYESGMSFSPTPEVVVKFHGDAIKQKIALLGRPLLAGAAALAILAMPGTPDTTRLYVAPDPAAMKFTNVFLLNSKLKGTTVSLRVTRLIRRAGEHGFAHYVQERLGVKTIRSIYGEKFGGLPSHQQKITSKVEQQSADIVPVGWSHFRTVMIILHCGLSLGGCVLAIEYVKHISFRIRRNIRQRERIEQRSRMNKRLLESHFLCAQLQFT